MKRFSILRFVFRVVFGIIGLLPKGLSAQELKSVSDSVFVTEQVEREDSVSIGTTLEPNAIEFYMSLNGRTHVQGGANHGRYLFVGHHGNKQIDVYDLEDKCYLDKINIKGSSSKCHANTINFGTRYYKPEDEFPLLYVSSGYCVDSAQSLSVVYVYRIQKNTDSIGNLMFSATQIQLIELMNFGTWTECICDNEHNALWIRCVLNKKRTFLKYNVPEANIKNVHIDRLFETPLDTIQVDQIPALKNAQGHLCKDGYIYFPVGVPNQVPFWVAVNLNTHEYEYIVDLYEVEGYDSASHRGINWEQEFFFFYNNEYYIGYHKHIQKVNLERLKEANYYFHRYMFTR